MDIAVNLVESYLRLNGYLTLSEFEIQGKTTDGTYRTLTDVDIVGLRFPGDVFAAESDDHADGRMLLIRDPALNLEEGQIDVIIGEVKQGEAVFNPRITSHQVLHTVIRRVDWIYGTDVGAIVDQLSRNGVAVTTSCNGGTVRTRLVAFGRSPQVDLHTISLSHIVEQMTSFMTDFDDVLRSANFKDPASALLRLLAKTGFTVKKERDDGG
ncbi:MAG TPA: hypothetical protein VLT15_02285 [Acidimicrobiia bacterium]|nr:hypothetical protein [Acidimicrobiia bacterium]